MIELVFATGNPHKVEEIQALMPPGFHLKSLREAGITGEIPEPFDTLEENALAKARYVYERTGMNVFAEDTGLEVAALGGKPGVHSARYAGNDNNPQANIERLLRELEGVEDRSARFVTVIALIFNGETHLFKGITEGEILRERSGSGGFGYDPVFKPAGYPVTYARMPLEMKNKISHRARALEQMLQFFSQLRENNS